MKGMSLIPSDSIRHSQLNSSTSKQSYGFPKAQRFKVPGPNCPIAFYSNSCELSRRRTSLGYGKKSDFTQSSVDSPACNLYNIRSYFEGGNKGRVSAVGREMSPENGIVNVDALRVPGPAKYDLVGVDQKMRRNIAFTMRPKTVDFIEKKITSKEGPGPAAYSFIEAFPKDGKCYFSKFSSSKFAKIAHSQRFQPQKQSPGPQSYNPHDQFSHSGKYQLSKHQGQGTRPFTHQSRRGFTDTISKNSISPGPGLYEKHSEFGVYGDVRYYKTLSSRNRSTIE